MYINYRNPNIRGRIERLVMCLPLTIVRTSQTSMRLTWNDEDDKIVTRELPVLDYVSYSYFPDVRGSMIVHDKYIREVYTKVPVDLLNEILKTRLTCNDWNTIILNKQD